jgi:hypothetical protein
MPEESISFDERGTGYVLIKTDESGRTSEMELSMDLTLSLCQSAQRMRRIVTERLLSATANPVIVTPVSQIELNVDAHAAEIQISMIDDGGAKQWFALPIDVAKLLVAALPGWIAKVEAAQRDTMVQ